MNSQGSTKLAYEDRLSHDVDRILEGAGSMDAANSERYPEYASLHQALVSYIKDETRRSYVNGLKAGRGRPTVKPYGDKRFYINGKPSARQAGKL